MKIKQLQLWLLCFAFTCVAQTSALRESERALLQGDAARAERLVARWLTTHPQDASAQVLLARAVLAQGKFQAAYQHLRHALMLDPNNIDALYYLGMVATALTQMEYQQLFALAPNSERVHQLQAESLHAQEKLTEAEAEYNAALEANPLSVEVLVALGDLKRSQSHFKQAAAYYTRALELAPNDYDALYGLGACLAYQQDHGQAATYFRRALIVEPKAVDAQFALGSSLFQLKKYNEAETELQIVVRQEPKLRQAYFLLGQIYQRSGRQEEARAAFTKFEQLAQEELQRQQGQKLQK
jgi:tetratricopeptide (TPR) repeat protein